MTRIVVAEDHIVVREGLCTVLKAQPDFHVVGEAEDGLQVVALVERLQPEVLVLDLMLPGLNGLEVARQVRQRAPQTRVVILSMYSTEAYVVEALRAGALGYILKRSSSAELVHAIHEAAAGRRYLSPSLSDLLIDAYIRRVENEALDPYHTLTAREREVLHLTASGHTNSDIAARLSISPRTVERHRANMMHKLGLQSHTDLIRYALQRGILPP